MTEVKLLGALRGHQNPIYALAIDELQNLLYSAGNDKGIVEWDLSTLKFNRVLCTVPSSVYKLLVISDLNILIASLRKGGIYVIDKKETKLLTKLNVDKGAIFSFIYNRSKEELIAVDEYGSAYVWSMKNYELLYSFKISNAAVRSMVLDETKSILYIGDKDGCIHVYNAIDYSLQTKRVIHEGSVTSLCFAYGFLFSGGRDAKMYKLQIQTLEVLQEVVPHMFTVYDIQSLNNNNLISTVSRDKTIKVWNTDFKLQKNISRDKGIDSHHLSINISAYHTGRQMFFSAGDDKLIKVWEITKG